MLEGGECINRGGEACMIWMAATGIVWRLWDLVAQIYFSLKMLLGGSYGRGGPGYGMVSIARYIICIPYIYMYIYR
jgi:hypothetical protein